MVQCRYLLKIEIIIISFGLKNIVKEAIKEADIDLSKETIVAVLLIL